MLKRVKVISQIVFFVLFVFLFFFFNTVRVEGTTSYFAWFLRMNPFVTLVTSISARSLVFHYVMLGTGILAITLIFGRVFCGMFCPLGSMIDAFDSLFRGREKSKQPLRPPVRLQGLKYILLVAIVLLAVFGITFPLFMDPLLLVTRFFALIVKPLMLFIAGASGLSVERLFSTPFLQQGGYAGAATTAVIFGIIFIGALFDRRFWCQYICPSGAFFGLLSRFTLFNRRHTGDKCNRCGICTDRYCPTRAIAKDKPQVTSNAECIRCGICSQDKRGCSRFGFFLPDPKITAGADIARRHFVGGTALGILFLPALIKKSVQKLPFVPGLIRPPGAVNEKLFLSRCITCGSCINVCPENALHPATLGLDGMASWNTPKLVPRIGYCKEDCTRCSEACPTGALMPLTKQQKSTFVLGIAFVDKNLCRPWAMTAPCLICFNKCPYQAIRLEEFTDEEDTTWQVPVVVKQKCVGCGACEYWCPVQQESAIKVIALAQSRERPE